jgi:hypothetical protein
MSVNQNLCEYPDCHKKATDELIFNGKCVDSIEYCKKHFKKQFLAIDPDDCFDEDTNDFVYLCQGCNIGLCFDDFRFENGKCEECNEEE